MSKKNNFNQRTAIIVIKHHKDLELNKKQLHLLLSNLMKMSVKGVCLDPQQQLSCSDSHKCLLLCV